MERKLKVLDLFSGIGGFALGLDSTGFFETVKFVEKDKYCQKVLRKNFPNIPIEEDIKNVEGKEYSADVVVGGFPCQPFSVAGKQKGTNDDRYLWPEMLRLIREIKPEFVIGENVQGIINLQNGMVLRQVQDQLESEGFEVQCFLIPASGIGAWHQRYRVWIVAHSQHNGLLAAESRCNEEKNRNERKDGEKNSTTGRSIGASSIRKTDNGYEGCRETSSIKETIVSDTNNIRFERDQQTTETTSGRRTEATSQSSGEDVSNTDTRLSIGENEEIQARRETIDSSSSRGSEDVPNTEVIGTGESRNINQEKRNESSGSTQSNSSSENVPNTNESLRGRRTTITHGGENKVWRFCVEEEGIRDNVRIETIGRNVVPGKETWWQIESNICGVPNGISYELDKDRSNRIKALGNAIVPQIAREFGLAIKKVMNEDTNI